MQIKLISKCRTKTDGKVKGGANVEQKELLELAEKLLKNVDINYIDDIEVSVFKKDDGQERIVIDISHDGFYKEVPDES